MRRAEIIRRKLESALSPVQLKILDESAHHAGHAGASPAGETHFRLDIISPKFTGLSQVARHRLVYAALGDVFKDGLHALAIYTLAPGE